MYSRLWRRQYDESIRCLKEMVRLLLQILLCNKGFFFYIILQKIRFIAQEIQSVNSWTKRRQNNEKILSADGRVGSQTCE